MLSPAGPCFEGFSSQTSPAGTSGDSYPISSPEPSHQYAGGYISDTTKREQRKIRNRESARRNRALRAQELKTLKKQVLDLKLENQRLNKCVANTRLEAKQHLAAYNEAMMTVQLLQEELAVTLDAKSMPQAAHGSLESLPPAFNLSSASDLMVESHLHALARLEYMPSATKAGSNCTLAGRTAAHLAQEQDLLYGCKATNKWAAAFEEEQDKLSSQLLKPFGMQCQGMGGMPAMKDLLPVFPPTAAKDPSSLANLLGCGDKSGLDWPCLPLSA